MLGNFAPGCIGSVAGAEVRVTSLEGPTASSKMMASASYAGTLIDHD